MNVFFCFFFFVVVMWRGWWWRLCILQFGGNGFHFNLQNLKFHPLASFPSLSNLQIMLFLLFNVLLSQKKLSFNGNHPQIIHTFKARTYLSGLFCISLSNGYFRAILSFPHSFSQLVLHKCLLQEGETSLLGFDV